jgi:hypothetical protein
MARKKQSGNEEPNLDSLLDVATNVVGILMMIFIILGVNMATTVGRILSELPRVTDDDLQLIRQQLAEIPEPVETPEELDKKQEIAQQELKKVIEEVKSIDITDMQNLVYMDLESFRKKLDEAKKQRENEKQETDKLLVEVERLKALLDETPEYKPEPATVVRIPNPRPYPKEPKETRVLVAKEGVIVFNQDEFMAGIYDGLNKMIRDLTYREIKIDPFAKLLLEVLGTEQVARQAWNDIAPLVSTFQMEDAAGAWKQLTAASLPATKEVLAGLGDIALTIRKPVAEVAGAVAALSKGDASVWAGLDPSRDPAKPTIKAEVKGGALELTYGGKTDTVRSTPRDVMAYFKTLSERDGIKNRGRNVVIYDAFKIQEAIQRAASNPLFSKVFNFEAEIRPGQNQVFLKLTPASGGGESIETIKRPESNFQRSMRQIAADPNGVALFQVITAAFASYLEARMIADENKVPATWETLASLDLSIPIRGFEVQRFAKAPVSRPRSDTDIIIRGPKRSLD